MDKNFFLLKSEFHIVEWEGLRLYSIQKKKKKEEKRGMEYTKMNKNKTEKCCERKRNEFNERANVEP